MRIEARSQGSVDGPTATAASARPTLAYRPALDGVRAVAVLGVLAYHGNVELVSGGFLGVDAFFVLSGYLITSLLVVEWDGSGAIAIGAFYARRARRLLPALFLMVGAVAAYAFVFADPAELAKIRGDALATLGYLANWREVVTDQSYFETLSAPSPLRHTWSLAIEEQWYFVWPIVVVGMLKLRFLRRALLPIVLALAVGSAVLMTVLYQPGDDPSRVYYGTDTRAQSLLVGAALALWLTGRGPIRSSLGWLALQLSGFVGVAYIALLWLDTTEASTWLYAYGLLFHAIAVAAVIAAVVQSRRGPIGEVLSTSPLVWIGRISYGLYLWHWPVYVLFTPARTGLEGGGLLAARLAATFGAATVSYYAVEMPIRRGALPSWRACVAAPATALVLVAAIVVTTRGAVPPGLPGVPTEPIPEAAATPVDSTRVLVAGDSVARQLAAGLRNRQAEFGFDVVDGTIPACGVGRGDAWRDSFGRELEPLCDWNAEWVPLVRRERPEVVVLSVGAADLLDRKIDGEWASFGSRTWDEFYLRELEAVREVLSDTGAPLVVLTSPYFQPSEDYVETGWYERDPAKVDHLNSLFRRFAERNPETVVVLDLNREVSPGGAFAFEVDGVQIRIPADGLHFSPQGVELVTQWLGPELVTLRPLGSRDQPVTASGTG